MPFRTDDWASFPGVGTVAETYESQFGWGPKALHLITGGMIYSGALDVGNVPTYELRPGLVMGQRTADAFWSNYSPTATDGTEVAAAVLLTALRMQDFFGVNQPRFYGLLVFGPVKASQCIGLDLMARSQMAKSFLFDDAFQWPGAHYFPYKRFVSKTANYTVLSTDNFTRFDNTGATGAVTFTLPPIANGYEFAFTAVANQSLAITSNEGGNIVALNNASANTITFNTAGQIVGGGGRFYTNSAATKWFFEDLSAGANTVTVS